jgi:hypothetical protein
MFDPIRGENMFQEGAEWSGEHVCGHLFYLTGALLIDDSKLSMAIHSTYTTLCDLRSPRELPTPTPPHV